MKLRSLTTALVFALSASLIVSTRADEPPADPKANPGSLFEPGRVNPLHDRVARRVGDIITIIVDERSVATYAASTQADKSDSNGINLNFFNDFLSRLFRPVTTSGTSSVQGDGRTSQNASMSARMSAVVRQVTPNGDLVIEGSRTLVTNRETQTLTISGVVRPFDVRSDNTVMSVNIAEAEIRMEGKGLVSDRQRKGILTQILDWLF